MNPFVHLNIEWSWLEGAVADVLAKLRKILLQVWSDNQQAILLHQCMGKLVCHSNIFQTIWDPTIRVKDAIKKLWQSMLEVEK